jgi:hypothetical protein
MSIHAQALLAGNVAQDSADNDVATATQAAVPNQEHYITGIYAEYDAAVELFKSITVTYGGGTLVFNHDFTNGAFAFAFPSILKGGSGTAVSVALAASGSGGTTGKAMIFTFLK